MSKQTAVEWLIEQIFLNKKYISYEESVAFEKAKAMERDQIEDAYGHGQNNGYMYANQKAVTIRKENYYNETYKGGEK